MKHRRSPSLDQVHKFLRGLYTGEAVYFDRTLTVRPPSNFFRIAGNRPPEHV